MTKVLGDSLAAALAAREQEKQADNERHACAVQAWADKGAYLDIGLVRQKDRTRHGGILPPESRPRPQDGRVPVTSLWECPSGTKHAPHCTCDAFVHGRPVSPQRVL